MKKSFMTRVLAVSLSAAMAFSLSSAGNLMTASAASTVKLATTFKTLKVKQTYQLKLKNNTLSWKISKVTTSDRTICMVYDKKASSVMLKGKKVGRATVKVTTKTTKRKTNNTKTMSCRVNVKAADTPTTPDVPDTPDTPTTTLSIGASATSASNVTVTFSQAVDAVEPGNFTISGGAVKVDAAEISADKKSAVLTLSGAAGGTTYTLNATGLKVNGTAMADCSTSFTTPVQATEYSLSLSHDLKAPYLKSDGASSTVITCQIKDRTGALMEVSDVVVEFTATRGNLGARRVTAQKGVAENTLRSEFLTNNVLTTITATIVESTSNKDLIGVTAVPLDITMTPNPDDYVTSIGAVITSAESNTADRVVGYFNTDVDVKNYLRSNGQIDPNKVDIRVYCGLNNNYRLEPTLIREVEGLLPVEGNSKAMQILVREPLIDNSNVAVVFTDKTGTQTAENTVRFKLTDARQPEVTKVDNSGYRRVVVDFSEAVLSGLNLTSVVPGHQFSADNAANYMIDGVPLDNPKYGVRANPATIEVGEFVNSTSTDNRHEVTITLGRDANGKRIYLPVGKHSIQIANVGDWASLTDGSKNIIETQTLDFEVEENTTVPAIQSVEVQSPEQYLVTFNSPVDINVLYTGLQRQIVDRDVDVNNSVIRLQWSDDGGVNWKDVSVDRAVSSREPNPIIVTQVDSRDETRYLVEVTKDWTDYFNTAQTRNNYYKSSYDFRLFIAKEAIENIDNGKVNSGDITAALTGPMESNDAVSPTIEAIDQIVDTNEGGLGTYYRVTMSEPVKIPGRNNEGSTPSELQTNGTGVPTPTAQFVKVSDGTTIDGTVLGFDPYDENFRLIDNCDKLIAVQPNEELTDGEWTLVVRSISDDVGNTAPSLTKNFTHVVPAQEQTFRVLWAVVSRLERYGQYNADGSYTTNVLNDRDQRGRYIFIKFSDDIRTYGSSQNVLATENYTINGRSLPQGTKIVSGILGYDRQAVENGAYPDSITIILPNNNEDVAGADTIVNISEAVQSRAGDYLHGEHELRLPYRYFAERNDTAKDAVWGNAPATAEAGEAREEYGDNTAYRRAVQAALDNDDYRTVILTGRVDGSLKISRPVDLVLNGQTITGDVTYDFTRGARVEITNENLIDNGRINGDLIVNTPNADVVIGNGVIIEGVRIDGIAKDTFINKGIIHNMLVTAANAHITNRATIGTMRVKATTVANAKVDIENASGATIEQLRVECKNAEVANGGTIKNTVVDTTGKVMLDGAGTYNNVAVTQKADITVDAKVDTITVDKDVTGLVIKKQADAEITHIYASSEVKTQEVSSDGSAIGEPGMSDVTIATETDLEAATAAADAAFIKDTAVTTKGALTITTNSTSQSAIEIVGLEVKAGDKTSEATYLSTDLSSISEDKCTATVDIKEQPTGTASVTEYVIVTCNVNVNGKKVSITKEIKITLGNH